MTVTEPGFMPEPFGARVTRAMQERFPICVGIDPHRDLLRAWGLADDAASAETFAMTVIEAVGSEIAFFKPQSAFFERFGSAGIAVLERVVAAGRNTGALVILDAKRGDIGSTAEAYADAYLNPASPLFADALTVSPYLGFGSVTPFVDAALASGSGLFVLAETSNPEGISVQRAWSESGKTVAQDIVDAAGELNAKVDGLGSIGVVVGATITAGGADLRSLNGPILAPGFGAQGATAADLRRVFPDGSVPIASYSREVLSAGPGPLNLRFKTRQFGREIRAALS